MSPLPTILLSVGLVRGVSVSRGTRIPDGVKDRVREMHLTLQVETPTGDSQLALHICITPDALEQLVRKLRAIKNGETTAP
jgi:hypothetical protein